MTSFSPNPGLGRSLAAAGEVEVVLHEKAGKGAEYARSIAPVLSGAFRDSIHADGHDIVADSVNDQGEPDAAYIEFGTFDTPAHGTLRRALDALEGL